MLKLSEIIVYIFDKCLYFWFLLSSSREKSTFTVQELLEKYPPKECFVSLPDIYLDDTYKFVNGSVKLKSTDKEKFVHTCYICFKDFGTIWNLRRHKLTVHKVNHESSEDHELSSTSKKTVRKSTTGRVNSKSKTDKKKSELLESTELTYLHTCTSCTATFDTIEEVKKHSSECASNKCKFTCGECAKNYNTLHAFTVHVLQHKINVFKVKETGKPAYICNLCLETFEEEFQLKTHSVLMHKVKSTVGNNQVLESSDSEDPSNTTKESNEFSCDLCFDIFTSQEDLQEHMELHEQLDKTVNKIDKIEITDDDDDENSIDSTLEENICIKNANDSAVASLHTTIVIAKDEKELLESDNETIINIPVIESSFSLAESQDEKPKPIPNNNNELNKNNQAETSTDLPSNEDTVMKNLKYEVLTPNYEIHMNHYRCSKCYRVYLTLDELHEHNKSKECTNSIHCERCGNNFLKNRDFYEHFSNVHSTKHICTFCFETFNYIKDLDEHKLHNHYKSVKNLCNICFECFDSSEKLSTHLIEDHLY